MNWKECLEKKLIVKTKPNRSLAIQMERMALVREEFLQHHVDQKFIALKLEAYYDIIKELLYAHMYKNGYACADHEWLVGYFEHHLHGFKEEYVLIEQLFAMKQKMHFTNPRKIQEFLGKNEVLLKKTIFLLKKRLQ